MAVTVTPSASELEKGEDETVTFEASVVTNGVENAKYYLDWSCDSDVLEFVSESVKDHRYVATYKVVHGGSATVTANVKSAKYHESEKQGSASVFVKEYAESLSFSATEYTFYLKQKINMIEYVTKKSAYANDSVSFSVDNTKVATVDAKGIVTMKKTGEVNITAASERGVVASAKIKVAEGNPVKSFKLDPKKPAVMKVLGDTQKISITDLKAKDGSSNTTDDFSWTSSKDSVATVTPAEDGRSAVVTAVGAGSAKITAQATSGKKVTVTVTVKPALTGLTLLDGDGEATSETNANRKVTLYLGRITGASTDAVTVSTSDKNLATASLKKDGTVVVTVKKQTNVQIGAAGKEVKIFAEAKGNSSVKAEYVLKIKQSDISAIGNLRGMDSLKVGETANYAATVTGGTAEDITWTSSNTKVLSIDHKGHAVALKAGTTKITATVTKSDGKPAKTAALKVTVTQPITSLSIKKNLVVVANDKGGSASFKATAGPKGVKVKKGDITYTITSVVDKAGTDVTKSRTGVTVDANGKVKVVKNSCSAGDIITVKASAGDVHTTGTIKVLSTKTKKLVFNNSAIQRNKATMKVGEKLELNVGTDPVENAMVEEFTYSVNKKGALAVSADGTVYAMQTGTFKVTVASTSGKKASVTITVGNAASATDTGDGADKPSQDGGDKNSHAGDDKQKDGDDKK
ncbi:MAG: Ig-like domain-containing protein [Acetatifactor sp.]|nr:Ig-like domain-containing protein [Acetatifactor sp.]